MSLQKVVAALVLELYSSILALEGENGEVREVSLSPMWCRKGVVWLEG